MDLNQLYQMLDMDSPAEFSYFEHFADLLENDKSISYDTYFQFFSQVEKSTLEELTSTYFEEFLNGVPDDEIDLYTLISSIGQTLVGLAKNLDDENNLHGYTEEFHRFRLWFFLEDSIPYTDLIHGKTQITTVNDALVFHRLSKLGGEAHSYDFSKVLTYPLEEYIFPISSFDYRESADEDEDEEAFEE